MRAFLSGLASICDQFVCMKKEMKKETSLYYVQSGQHIDYYTKAAVLLEFCTTQRQDGAAEDQSNTELCMLHPYI